MLRKGKDMSFPGLVKDRKVKNQATESVFTSISRALFNIWWSAIHNYTLLLLLMHFSKTFHRSGIQGPAFIFLHSRQEGRVLGHQPGAHICKPIPTASQRESVWKAAHKSNWKLCSINKRKIPFGDLRLYECCSSSQDAQVKRSQIIAFVSVKYRAESHAETCGHRPKKKPPVVDVKEKKVLRVSMKTNSSQEHLKEIKRQELLVRSSKPPAPAEATGMERHRRGSLALPPPSLSQTCHAQPGRDIWFKTSFLFKCKWWESSESTTPYCKLISLDFLPIYQFMILRC